MPSFHFPLCCCYCWGSQVSPLFFPSEACKVTRSIVRKRLMAEKEGGSVQTSWVKGVNKFLWCMFFGNVCVCKNLFKTHPVHEWPSVQTQSSNFRASGGREEQPFPCTFFPVSTAPSSSLLRSHTLSYTYF